MRVASALIETVFPQRCLACPTACAGPFCATCALSIVPVAVEDSCPRCGEPQDLPTPTACGRCRRDGWAMETTWAAVEHGGAARRAVHRLKYGGRWESAARLARHFESRGTAWDRVVPVPLHRLRRWGRGFDQAALLAREVGRALQCPVGTRDLVRVRRTAPQARASATARAANVQGAFRVRSPEAIRGRRILLVDDVVTTGATMGSCARALRAAGADAVGGWSFARG